MIACGVRRESADIFSSRLKMVCGNVIVLLMVCPLMHLTVWILRQIVRKVGDAHHKAIVVGPSELAERSQHCGREDDEMYRYYLQRKAATGKTIKHRGIQIMG